MSESKSTTPIIVTNDPSADDDIYIDCQPVKVDDVTSDPKYNGDNSIINNEILTDLSNTELNIFENPGVQSILAVGIFVIILVSGNYVFNKLPNSKLQKAIDKEKNS